MKLVEITEKEMSSAKIKISKPRQERYEKEKSNLHYDKNDKNQRKLYKDQN